MRYAKHFDKDLYSKWHRKYEGIAMCDIDSVEICRNKGCWQPLALIEHVYDTGNYKKYTNVIKSLGKAANLPIPFSLQAAFIDDFNRGLRDQIYLYLF